MDSLRQGLKHGPGYIPLTPAAIRPAACFQCRQFDNPRLLGGSAIRCGSGGLLRVVHGRTALDYMTGCVTRPRDWMSQQGEVLIAWDFN